MKLKILNCIQFYLHFRIPPVAGNPPRSMNETSLTNDRKGGVKVHIFHLWALLLLFLTLPTRISAFRFCVANSASSRSNHPKSSVIINHFHQFPFSRCRFNATNLGRKMKKSPFEGGLRGMLFQ